MSSVAFRISASGVTMETPGLLSALHGRLVTPRPDCTLWPDPDQQGYGRVTVDGRERRVHRVFWELANGPIPDGMVIDHLCRVRSCCNTDHMEVVTQQENARRGALTPRPAALLLVPPLPSSHPLATHCKRGHEFTPENTRVRSDGWRRCLTCARANEASRPPRKKTRA